MSYICGASCKASNFNIVYIYMELLVKPEILMSYIYGAPCKARNVIVVYIYIYELTFGKAENPLFLLAAQCLTLNQ
jgi:hypothetical protein